MMSLNLHKPYPTTHHHHQQHHSNNITTRRRTHLKPSQVAVLQESFVTNTLPDATMRAQLAQDLGVTERTVQIWFQNRRAKARKLEVNTGLPTSLVPNVRTGWIEMPPPPQQQMTTTFRSFITPECFENEPNIKRRPRSSSKPEKNTSFIVPTPPPQRAMSEGMGRILSGVVGAAAAETNKDKQHLVSFPVNTIRIGSWARFASQTSTGDWDLVCFSDPLLRQLIWQVQDDGHQFRIEVDYENIRQIRLGQASNLSQLDIDIIEPTLTSFSMRRRGIDQDWVRCGDFTESQQASLMDAHALQGSHDALRQSLLELISQAPDQASKLVIIPDHDFLVRDLTISPSATPEPNMAAYLQNDSFVTMMDHKNPWNNNNSYYQQSTPSSSSQSYDQQQQNWTYLNMLQQHQHHHNVLQSFI